MPNQAQKRILNLQRNQHILYIGVFSVVAAIIWVGTSLFQSQHSSGIDPELQKLAEPLNPNINSFAVDRLEQRRSFSQEELADFPIYKLELEQEQADRVQAQPQTEADSQQPPETALPLEQNLPSETNQNTSASNEADSAAPPLTNSEGTPLFPIDGPASPNDSI